MPTINPPRARECIGKWKERGYQCAVFLDSDTKDLDVGADIAISLRYDGYWNAINFLCHYVSEEDIRAPRASRGRTICIASADDIYPDFNHSPEELAGEFHDKFPDGFGIMQPCGDLSGIDQSGRPAAARICGSPWMGDGWICRAYGGRGPCPREYHSFYGDEELYEVSQKLEALWMRPDLTQLHKHWSFGHGSQTEYQRKNSEKYWDIDQRTFISRRELGFPGCEPS